MDKETKEAMEELDRLGTQKTRPQAETAPPRGEDITARMCQMMNKFAELEEENKKLRKEVEDLQQEINSLRSASAGGNSIN